MFGATVLAAAGQSSSSSYSIANSLRFSGAQYLSRTFGTPTDQKKWTYSVWCKRSKLGARQHLLFGESSASYYESISFDPSDRLEWYRYNTAYRGQKVSSAVFRDVTAWYHVVVQMDAANTSLKVWINGAEITSWSTNNSPLNEAGGINYGAGYGPHNIGRDGTYNAAFTNGYLSDIYFIDGQALTPTSFGQTNSDGVWVPAAYTGTYGTNGFHLLFDNGTSTTTLGYDKAGSNNWTLTGFTRAAGTSECWMTDTPTNNFAVLSPIDGSGGGGTFSNGALTVDPAYSTAGVPRGSIWVSSGKWYWEITANSAAAGLFVGVSRSDGLRSYYPGYTSDTGGVGYNQNNGQKYINGTGSSYGATWTTNDVLGVALDMDSGAVYFSVNGQWANGSGSSNQVWASAVAAQTGMSGLYAASCGDGSSNGATVSFNFGQGNVASAAYDSASGGYFKYTPPTGFKALCTANRAYAAMTTSGSFTGNSSADGPFVWLNGNPESMTINGNAVTFGTHADKTAGGFKVRNSTSSYNASGSNTYSITSSGKPFGDSTHAPNTAKGNP